MPQVRNTSTIGTSSNPEIITARVPLLLSLAASMRCTISWSVPMVAMVMKVAPSTALHRVYSLPRMFRTSSRKPRPVVPQSNTAQGCRFSRA